MPTRWSCSRSTDAAPTPSSGYCANGTHRARICTHLHSCPTRLQALSHERSPPGNFPLRRWREPASGSAAVPITLHQLQDAAAVVAMTQRLERKSAYVVLAEQLNAELWTLDGPPARNASPCGLPVKLIETP